MSRSDSKAYLTSLAPEGPEFRDAQGKTEAELAERARKEMDNVTGFKIIEKEFTSDNEAILTVYASGVNQTAKFRLQRVGAEWKFTGPVKDSPPPNAR